MIVKISLNVLLLNVYNNSNYMIMHSLRVLLLVIVPLADFFRVKPQHATPRATFYAFCRGFKQTAVVLSSGGS